MIGGATQWLRRQFPLLVPPAVKSLEVGPVKKPPVKYPVNLTTGTGTLNTSGGLSLSGEPGIRFEGWAPQTAPDVRYGASVFHNGAMYVTGSVGDVYRVTYLPDGSVDDVETLTALPVSVSEGALIAWEGNLYYLGGLDVSGNYLDEVYKGTLAPNGTISSWSLHGTLPAGFMMHTVTPVGDYWVLVGGYRDDTDDTDNQTTYLLDPVTLAATTHEIYKFPVPVSNHTAWASGSTLYVLGGLYFQTTTADVDRHVLYKLLINEPSPAVGWQAVDVDLPKSWDYPRVLVTNSHVWLFGGLTSSDLGPELNQTVYWAPLNTTTFVPVADLEDTEPGSVHWVVQDKIGWWLGNQLHQADIKEGYVSSGTWESALIDSGFLLTEYGVPRVTCEPPQTSGYVIEAAVTTDNGATFGPYAPLESLTGQKFKLRVTLNGNGKTTPKLTSIDLTWREKTFVPPLNLDTATEWNAGTVNVGASVVGNRLQATPDGASFALGGSAPLPFSLRYGSWGLAVKDKVFVFSPGRELTSWNGATFTGEGHDVLAGTLGLRNNDGTTTAVLGGKESLLISEDGTFMTGPSSPMPLTAYRQAIKLRDGRYWIVCGGPASVFYDPEAKTFALGPDMPGRVGEGSLILDNLDGSVLVVLAGGRARTLVFDGTTFTEGPNCPVKFKGTPQAVELDDYRTMILVQGSKFPVWNPKSLSWTTYDAGITLGRHVTAFSQLDGTTIVASNGTWAKLAVNGEPTALVETAVTAIGAFFLRDYAGNVALFDQSSSKAVTTSKYPLTPVYESVSVPLNPVAPHHLRWDSAGDWEVSYEVDGGTPVVAEQEELLQDAGNYQFFLRLKEAGYQHLEPWFAKFKVDRSPVTVNPEAAQTTQEPAKEPSNDPAPQPPAPGPELPTPDPLPVRQDLANASAWHRVRLKAIPQVVKYQIMTEAARKTVSVDLASGSGTLIYASGLRLPGEGGIHLENWLATAAPFLRGAQQIYFGGNLYVVGGESDTGISAASYVVSFFPSGLVSTITAGNPLPAPRKDGALATDGANLYYFGGSDGEQPVSSVYKLTAGTWTLLGTLPEPLAGHTVVYAGGYFVVAGGYTTTGPSKKVHLLNPVTLAPLNERFYDLEQPRVGHTAWAYSDVMYLAGGYLYDEEGRAQQTQIITSFPITGLNPTGNWKAEGSLPQAVSGMKLFQDGVTTYLFGGISGTEPVSKAYRLLDDHISTVEVGEVENAPHDSVYWKLGDYLGWWQEDFYHEAKYSFGFSTIGAWETGVVDLGMVSPLVTNISWSDKSYGPTDIVIEAAGSADGVTFGPYDSPLDLSQQFARFRVTLSSLGGVSPILNSLTLEVTAPSGAPAAAKYTNASWLLGTVTAPSTVTGDVLQLGVNAPALAYGASTSLPFTITEGTWALSGPAATYVLSPYKAVYDVTAASSRAEMVFPGALGLANADGTVTVCLGGRKVSLVDLVSGEWEAGNDVPFPLGEGAQSVKLEDGRYWVLCGGQTAISLFYDPGAKAFSLGPLVPAIIGEGCQVLPGFNGTYVILVGGGSKQVLLFDGINGFDVGPEAPVAVSGPSHALELDDHDTLVLVPGGLAIRYSPTGGYWVSEALPFTVSAGLSVLGCVGGEYLIAPGGAANFYTLAPNGTFTNTGVAATTSTGAVLFRAHNGQAYHVATNQVTALAVETYATGTVYVSEVIAVPTEMTLSWEASGADWLFEVSESAQPYQVVTNGTVLAPGSYTIRITLPAYDYQKDAPDHVGFQLKPIPAAEPGAPPVSPPKTPDVAGAEGAVPENPIIPYFRSLLIPGTDKPSEDRWVGGSFSELVPPVVPGVAETLGQISTVGGIALEFAAGILNLASLLVDNRNDPVDMAMRILVTMLRDKVFQYVESLTKTGVYFWPFTPPVLGHPDFQFASSDLDFAKMIGVKQNTSEGDPQNSIQKTAEAQAEAHNAAKLKLMDQAIQDAFKAVSNTITWGGSPAKDATVPVTLTDRFGLAQGFLNTTVNIPSAGLTGFLSSMQAAFTNATDPGRPVFPTGPVAGVVLVMGVPNPSVLLNSLQPLNLLFGEVVKEWVQLAESWEKTTNQPLLKTGVVQGCDVILTQLPSGQLHVQMGDGKIVSGGRECLISSNDGITWTIPREYDPKVSDFATQSGEDYETHVFFNPKRLDFRKTKEVRNIYDVYLGKLTLKYKAVETSIYHLMSEALSDTTDFLGQPKVLSDFSFDASQRQVTTAMNLPVAGPLVSNWKRFSLADIPQVRDLAANLKLMLYTVEVPLNPDNNVRKLAAQLRKTATQLTQVGNNLTTLINSIKSLSSFGLYTMFAASTEGNNGFVQKVFEAENRPQFANDAIVFGAVLYGGVANINPLLPFLDFGRGQ